MLKGYDKTLTGNAALGQKTITVMPDANNPDRVATFSIQVEDIKLLHLGNHNIIKMIILILHMEQYKRYGKAEHLL